MSLLDNITHDHTYSLPPTAENVDRRVPVMKQGTSSESVESLPSFPMNDELNDSDGIVEIKCPYSKREVSSAFTVN